MLAWVSSGPYPEPLIINPFEYSQQFGNPRLFAWGETSFRNAFTAAGSVSQNQSDIVQVMDLTDGAGHGILIATDSIFIAVSEVGYTGPNTIGVKIMYRLVEVGLQEYIGLVQSQQ
jgi:hypothetical protein